MCAGGIVLLLLQLGWPAMADYSISTEEFDDDNDYADGAMYDINDEDELAYTSRVIGMSKRVKKKHLILFAGYHFFLIGYLWLLIKVQCT